MKKDSSGIEVVTPKLMSKAHNKMDVCIIDEADYIVEEKNFVFVEQEKELLMNGACRAYQAEKIIFMSARFNDQQRRFLKQAFDVPIEKVLEFSPRNQIEMTENKGEELEHEAEVNDKEELLVEQMCERVEMEVAQRPVIIFQGAPN